MLVELVEDRDIGLGGGHIAQAPAGHGVGLGHAVHGEGPLLHARQGGDANVLLPIVDEPLIHLVGDD